MTSLATSRGAVLFVDSNVPMYLVGLPHPNRNRLESFIRANAHETYVTSAEVYQEVIHRYVAIDRRPAIGDCFTLLDALVQHVYPITKEEVIRARIIAETQRRLSGRDCLHIATMERHGLDRVLTCDEDFDLWSGIIRLP
jgi:predicted nucleic acid-binding protein